ncbi:MAG: hypothetical protein HS113_27445 [Verrucomicrobiales bacterium]|nr:hypothetical protein [Verrucomicrobiales bacterium]
MQTRRSPHSARPRRDRGSLTAELLIALGLLAFTLLPLSMSFQREQVALRALYTRALAMELVDGELEVLRAGAWQAFSPGIHAYEIRAEAVRNLPPGQFQLTVETNRLRLEWLPAGKGGGGPVVREARLDAVDSVPPAGVFAPAGSPRERS